MTQNKNPKIMSFADQFYNYLTSKYLPRQYFAIINFINKLGNVHSFSLNLFLMFPWTETLSDHSERVWNLILSLFFTKETKEGKCIIYGQKIIVFALQKTFVIITTDDAWTLLDPFYFSVNDLGICGDRKQSRSQKGKQEQQIIRWKRMFT